MALIPQTTVHRVVMHTIVILFGIGAWVAINGVFVELPILVDKLPEGWSLPSFMVLLTQAANVGPLVVALMQAFAPRHYHQNALIYIMLVLGTLSCFLLIFVWDITTVVAGNEHSIAFFALFLVLAFVDCTSSVTFMPFMTRFQSVFLTTYFIGEGLSGFVPSIFALIQGASEAYCKNESFVNTTTNETTYHIVTHYYDPRFSAEVFFGFLCVMMICCSAAFIMLNHLRIAKSFMQVEDQDSHDHGETDVHKSTSTELSTLDPDNGTEFYTRGKEQTLDDITSQTLPSSKRKLSYQQYAYFYLMVLWISGISNGVMPSVISYSSLPYGQLPYHFAATLGAMANPVACFIALFLPVTSELIIAVFVTITTGFASYLMLLAVESPCPILVDTDGGAILMVISQIMFVFTTSYAKVSIGQILRERGHPKSLVWYGAFTQLGSLIGALIMFPLVNIYYLFTPGDQCTTVCG
uniref:solute carrier family 52, riboflavin transporter, member 3-B-like n=1 Tax=Styela clava TaxID=7725 RepID=UPI0019396CF5|nr:solute carrier family 52, riboflavin transporter, member 3-B-like [Styela clava]